MDRVLLHRLTGFPLMPRTHDKLHHIAAFAGMALFLVACRREDKPPPLPDNVVAGIEWTTISPEMLANEVLRQGYTNGWDDAVENCLEEIIRSEAVYLRAKEEGFDKSPQALAAIRTNLPPDANEALRLALSKQIIVARFLETHLGLDASKVQIPDAEIEEYFRKNPEEFTIPPLAHGALIFVRVPTNSTPESTAALKERAESLRTNALEQKELAEFASLAARHSDDAATRNVGGEMGWIRQGTTNRWPVVVLQALFALRERGDLSPVVVAPDGFYILRLVKYRPASIAPWTEAREQIRFLLAEKKEAARADQFFASLKAGFRIQVNRELVKAVKQQLATNAPAAQVTRGNP